MSNGVAAPAGRTFYDQNTYQLGGGYAGGPAAGGYMTQQAYGSQPAYGQSLPQQPAYGQNYGVSGDKLLVVQNPA